MRIAPPAVCRRRDRRRSRSIAPQDVSGAAPVPAHRAEPRGKPMHPAPGRVLRAKRQLRHRRPARSRHAHAHRARGDSLAQHRTRADRDSLRLHLYWNAWRNTASTWMREAALAGGDTSARPAARLVAQSTSPRSRSPTPTAAAPDLMPAFTFVQPDDGNPDDRTLASVACPRRAARRRDRAACRVDAARPAHVRADWRDRQLLLHRALVPEGRGLRRRPLDRAPVPRQHRVLRGLRPLRRAHDRAARLDRRRHRRRAVAHRQCRRHHDPSLRQDDVHDFTWTTSPTTSSIGRRSSIGLPLVEMRLLMQPEHARSGGPPFRCDRGRAALLRRVVWRLSLRPRHDRRSRVSRAAPAAWSIRRSSPPARAGSRRVRPTPEAVTVHEAGHQFWYAMVGNNEFEHAWLDEGLNTFSEERVQSIAFQPNYRVERFFGGFIPWQFRDIPLTRDRRQCRLNAHRARPRATTPARRPFATGRARTPDHLQQDGAVAEHAGAIPRLGHAAAHPVDLLRALEVPPSAPGRLLRGRQRGQRAGPDVVLRSGLPQLERVRLRRRPVRASGRAQGLDDGDPLSERERPIAPRWSCGVSAKPSFPVDGRHDVHGRATRSPSTGTASTGGACTPTIGRRARQRSHRSDRMLLLDVNYTNNSGARSRAQATAADQVVADVDGLAAGPVADVGVLCLARHPGPTAGGGHDVGISRGIVAGLCRLTSACGLALPGLAGRITLRGMLADHPGEAWPPTPRRRASTSTGGTSSPRPRASATRSCRDPRDSPPSSRTSAPSSTTTRRRP